MTYTSQDQINGLQPDDNDVEINYNNPDSCLSLEEIMDMIRDPDNNAHWEGRSFVWTTRGYRNEEGESMGGERMVETFPYKYVKKCPDCLHGWCRDVPPYGDDEECWRCDGTGYLKND